MITQESFRRTEQMLLAAADHLSAEAIIAMIALTMEHATDRGDEREALRSEVSFPLSLLADRLGCDRKAAAIVAGQAAQEVREKFGINLLRVTIDGECIECDVLSLDEFARASVVVAPGFVSLVQGRGLVDPRSRNPTPALPDDASQAAIELVGRISKTGGSTALLLRLTGGLNTSRSADVCDAVDMIAAGLGRSTVIFIERDDDGLGLALKPAAFLVLALLHAINPVVVIARDLFAPIVRDDDEYEFDSLPQKLPSHRKTSAEGELLFKLIPSAPATVLVAIEQDAVLHPDHAKLFATAIGPLRAERAALVETLRIASGGDLTEAVAERLVGFWNGRTDYARSILDASARIVSDADSIRSESSESLARDPMVYNAVVTALTAGIAPHVPATSAYRPKRRVEFYHELFVTDPPTEELFLELSAGSPKLILHGIPGTGKSAASAYIGSAILKMETMEIRPSDVLFHRLGHLEKAIATAFREAKRANAVLIFDEAESLAQNRATTSAGNAPLATAITNALLVEIDDHDLPIIFATNFLDRIDTAIVRRADVVAEVKPIPEELEALAVELTLGSRMPNSHSFNGGGQTVIADYAAARKARRLRNLDLEASLAIVLRARDTRLGEAGRGKRFGFLRQGLDTCGGA